MRYPDVKRIDCYDLDEVFFKYFALNLKEELKNKNLDAETKESYELYISIFTMTNENNPDNKKYDFNIDFTDDGLKISNKEEYKRYSKDINAYENLEKEVYIDFAKKYLYPFGDKELKVFLKKGLNKFLNYGWDILSNVVIEDLKKEGKLDSKKNSFTEEEEDLIEREQKKKFSKIARNITLNNKEGEEACIELMRDIKSLWV